MPVNVKSQVTALLMLWYICFPQVCLAPPSRSVRTKFLIMFLAFSLCETSSLDAVAFPFIFFSATAELDSRLRYLHFELVFAALTVTFELRDCVLRNDPAFGAAAL